MTKMRVHELAKELGMDNKELVDILQKKNVEVKNHMSTVEDNVADEIRREVSSKGENKAQSGEDKNAAKPSGQPEAKEGAAPKKKNLAFVIRPQNSRNSSRIQGNRQAQRPPVRASREPVRYRQAHVLHSQVPVRYTVRVRQGRDLHARRTEHVRQLRADLYRRQKQLTNARFRQNVRRRIPVLHSQYVLRQKERVQENTQYAQNVRRRLSVLHRADARPLREDRQERDLHARITVRTADVRMIEETAETVLTVRCGETDRTQETVSPEGTGIPADVHSAAETDVRDVRRGADATRETDRDLALTEEIPAGMI